MTDCPLCGGGCAPARTELQGRPFHDCGQCGLLFVERVELPGAEDERARYATHRNDPADAGYRGFLDRLAAPLVERLAAGAEGLDYGSGPGPTLSMMLAERGFPTAIWDPFFAPDPGPLQRRWDFVTCSEVVEHLHRPIDDLSRIAELLRPGAWFGVMTGMVTPEVEASLSTWWYARDPTHVAFYRPRTMAWIAGHFGWSMEPVSETVVLFQTPEVTRGR